MSGTAIACATVARSVAHHGKLHAHQREALRRLHDRPRLVQQAWDASRVPVKGKTITTFHFRGCRCMQCGRGPTGE